MSITRLRINGPRSLIRTTTDFPFARFVGTKPTLADGLHLSQGDWLGLVLSQHDPG